MSDTVEQGVSGAARAVELTVESPVSSGLAMVPLWARSLAPRVVESRTVLLSGGEWAGFEVSRGEDVGTVTAVVPGAVELSAEDLRAAVDEVFTLVLGGLRESGFAYPVRIWNFVPSIHGCMGEGGLNRYHVFNSGRYDAFARWFAGPAAFARVLPAASAVGHHEGHLVVSALGTRTPGVPVENPRQTPAFDYSKAYGPRPPCFARATVAQLPMGTRLLVSGTASIRGEESVHEGSLSAQLDETFANLERLVSSVPGDDRFDLGGCESVRVYFPRAADRGELVAKVSSALPASVGVEYVPAWICREELLVEIEGIVAPTV